jgi:hypothetical protein
MKREYLYILAGVGLFFAGYLIGRRRTVKPIGSDFVGVSKQDYLKNPYTKAGDSSGYSQVFRLSDFFHNPTRKLIDFTQVEILQTRILNGQKFYNIGKDEWVMAQDVQIPNKK